MQREGITRIAVGDPDDGPYAVVVDPAGDIWTTLPRSGRAACVAAGGNVTMIDLGNPAARPMQLAVDAGGAVWCARTGDDRVDHLTPDGVGASHRLATGTAPYGLAAGPDGALWFTAMGTEAIGRIDTGGAVSSFRLPYGGGMPAMITTGPDGALWFTLNRTGAIGRIDPAGTMTTTALPDPQCGPVGIAADTEGLWFTEILAGRIGRLVPGAAVREFALPDGAKPHAVLAGDGCWATLWGSNGLAHVTAAGEVATHDLFDEGDEPHGIARLRDGRLVVALESGALAVC